MCDVHELDVVERTLVFTENSIYFYESDRPTDRRKAAKGDENEQIESNSLNMFYNNSMSRAPLFEQ